MMVILTSSPSPLLPLQVSASSVRIQLILLCYFISNTIAILEQIQASSASAASSDVSRKRRFRFPQSEKSDYYLYSYGKPKIIVPQNQIVGPIGVESAYSHSHSFPIAYYGKFYGHSPVRFYLYSLPLHKYQIAEEIIAGNSHSLKNSNYNPKHSLILIVHGFLSNATYPRGEVDRLRQAYFETKTKANIIGVDYSPLASPNHPRNAFSSLYYGQAIRNAPTVASAIVEFILFLMKSGYLHSLAQVHMIGFSLGAHIAGKVGRNIQKQTGQQIGRITGLDPAGFMFHLRSRDSMLDATDAKFVDVTHTAQGFYGFHGKLGHVDYYVNGGGPIQPGCILMAKPSTLIASCSHSRAYWYFAESIRNPRILACRCRFCYLKKRGRTCPSPVIFGQHVDQRVRGNFNVQIEVKS